MTKPETTLPTDLPPVAPAPAQRWRMPLLLAVMLALIPALMLAAERIRYEQDQHTVTLMMDYPALVAQAKRYGQDSQLFLDKYKALGINGIGMFEDVVGNLVQRGEVYIRSGADLAVEQPQAGFATNRIYMRSLKPGVAEALPARYNIPTREVSLGGYSWVEWPVDPQFLPAGPDQNMLAEFNRQKLVLAYRPYNDDSVKEPGADWPNVPFVIFNGDEVIGARTPELLEKINQRLGQRVPAMVEFNDQRGLDTLVETHGAVRTFSLQPAHQNKLQPEEVASKYALAARERSMRILYVRPFPTTNETEAMLTRTVELLKKDGIQIGTPVIRSFEPSTTLRWLTLLGPLAALMLVGLSYPLPRVGLLVTGLFGLLALALNKGQPFPSGALIAAIAFPSLGLVLRRGKVWDWLLATGLSLVGVLFVSALGANRESVLGLEPFRGVGLTLLAPLVLVGLSFLPRQDIRKTVADIYSAPIRLGDILIMGLGLAVFALVFLRRGNTSSVGVSDTEAKIRQDLQDSIIRPRFKELAGHPLALLGLSGILPGYFNMLLILGGVIGQASILNTFSHFHTPLLISATRCIIGIVVGFVAGLVAIEALKLALRLWKTYGAGWEKA